MEKHTVHTETLYHFNCERCGAWWTVGDWQESTHCFCPQCGTRLEVLRVDLENADND